MEKILFPQVKARKKVFAPAANGGIMPVSGFPLQDAFSSTRAWFLGGDGHVVFLERKRRHTYTVC
ncbi:MAG: hypothetical protein IKF56_02555, partial [Eggerthellaceae bacterium]|nr:hypothetical protein [Eggerthellaceae bacterium]